jgi:purine-binding chemotaxis protein CheW
MAIAAPTQSARELVPSGQLVTFSLDGVEFGLDIDRVQEITPRTDITPVPGAPSFLLGVINLRGQIIPVLDSRQRFHLQPAEQTPKTRIIIIDLAGEPTGLQVDAVAEVVKLDDYSLKATPPLVAGVRSEYLAGMVTAGSRLITLIDLNKILDSSEFTHRELLTHDNQLQRGFAGQAQAALEEATDERPFVTFSLGTESFGVALEHIDEIVDVPQVTKVPDAPDYVLGVICVRDQVLPLLDFTRLLRVDGAVRDAVRGMVILLSFGTTRLGMVVDGIQEVMRIKDEEILPAPQTLSDQERGHLDGIVVRPGRMVSLLRVMEILDREDHQKLASMSNALAPAQETEKAGNFDLPLVVFRLGEESFGLHLEEVREIIMVGQITPVPRAPAFVDGVLNLRGEVMPVLDLRTRFGLERKPKTSVSRVLISPIAGVFTGLVVDSVQEVRTVDQRRLEDPPQVTSAGANAYITKVARTEKGMIFLLNLQRLLTDVEARQLDTFQGRKKG